MRAGIYYILCKRNDRIYVGQSGNVSKRFMEHRTTLRAGRHYNAGLQADWSTYGEDAFEFGTLGAERNPRERARLEQMWVNTYRADDPALGYNVVTSKYDRSKVSGFARRFMDALERIGTPAEQEAAFPNISPRALRYWRRGEVPNCLEALEAAGIITINV